MKLRSSLIPVEGRPQSGPYSAPQAAHFEMDAAITLAPHINKMRESRLDVDDYLQQYGAEDQAKLISAKVKEQASYLRVERERLQAETRYEVSELRYRLEREEVERMTNIRSRMGRELDEFKATLPPPEDLTAMTASWHKAKAQIEKAENALVDVLADMSERIAFYRVIHACVKCGLDVPAYLAASLTCGHLACGRCVQKGLQDGMISVVCGLCSKVSPMSEEY